MTGTALFFVIVGACVASGGLMKAVEWLDTPRGERRAKRAM